MKLQRLFPTAVAAVALHCPAQAQGLDYSKLVARFCLALVLLLGAASPALAQTMEVLHTTSDAGLRDDFAGVVGGIFEVGATNVTVSHLGFYDSGGDGLAADHHVGLWTEDGSTLMGSVLATNGVDVLLTNGYRWVALDAPLMLFANTSYVLGAEVGSGDGDEWSDYGATNDWNWNPMYVGTNGAATRDARYGYSAWPNAPVNGSGYTWGTNGMYGALNMATWAIGPAKAGMGETSVFCLVGQTATIHATGNGEAPVSVQWYKAPGTLLPGQTSTTLVLPGAANADNGNYYIIATNGLGSMQSASCALTVSDVPVSITMSPTNVTVYQNFNASFYVSASGSPPITYQWQRNGSPIADATQTSYTLAAAAATNNSDVYSCMASNNAPGPHTATSSGATLTVLPNEGQGAPVQLFATLYTGYRADYSGTVGTMFTVGNVNAVVSHLGFYDKDGDGLAANHNVGLWTSDGGTLLASVLVPAGTGAFLANGYRWVALDSPFVSTPNTTYILGAEVNNGDGDEWPDGYNPSSWSTFYLGANDPTTNCTLVWGSVWPSPPTSTWNGAPQTYGAANMALMPVGALAVAVNPPAVSQYAQYSASFTATANGVPPVTMQWYKAPSTLLTGQTNATLTLPSLTMMNVGDYYVVASNALGTNQSSNVTLTVLPDTPPQITQDLQSQTAYIHQTVQFSVAVTGPPPSYEWEFKGSTIPNATNSTLTFTDVSTANAGNYQVVITNAYGSTNSALASLTVLTPPAGSYVAGIIAAEPLVYYRFDDAGSGTALNLGTLGLANNGTYEGGCSSTSGPQPPAFPRFESTNSAVALDGVGADVLLPALNLDNYSGNHVTLAAWVNLNGLQPDYTGLIYRRGSLDNGGSGLEIRTDATGTTNMLMYSWANAYWGFSSGLYIPDSRWAFVALVIEPNQATLYLQDGTQMLSATNVAPHTPVGFVGSFWVGWDNNSGAFTQRLYGAVDEVMIFGRALSPAEITMIYYSLPPTQLSIMRSGAATVLSWPSGTLQQADLVAGPYSDMTGVTSPYTNTSSAGQKFYRVRVQ